MGQLQQVLKEHLAELPKLVLRQMLERKLQDQQVVLPPVALEALLDHLLTHTGEHFTWDDASVTDKQIQLTFDETDSIQVKKVCDGLIASIPEIVENVTAKGGKGLFRALKNRWTIEGAVQQYELNEFRERLEERWGEGLELLRMLLAVIRELDHEAMKRLRRSKSKKYANRRFVLMHLHLRACQVADEIITLMENGFADGAMARWRTLHELDVVATLIENGDEELAKRYIDHDVVEVKKHADEYARTLVPLGYPPVHPREHKQIEKDYADAVQRYGKSFGTDYGWASTLLREARPTFQQLQNKANQSQMNGYYKLANFNVHAGARTMFFRMTDLGANVPIAGRSNSGLVDPGQNTAFTLMRITNALLGRARDLDRIVELTAIIAMRDAIPKALERADRRLRRDEAKIQRDRKQIRGRRRTTHPVDQIPPTC